jgi:proteasome lid subunit RPN8/RPN11
MTTLQIRKPILERLFAHARAAGTDECMGLLASRLSAPPGLVTAAWRLPAEASPGHAEVSPEVLHRAARRLRARRMRPVGLWHSHGLHNVYHSNTDDETTVRLLPAMAEWNFERAAPPWGTPAVTGPDSAVLPLADGQFLRCTLLGPPIPGLDAHERAQWGQVTTRFLSAPRPAGMMQKGNVLLLRAGEIGLRLEIPEGASVNTQVEDVAPYRRARLFSVVVNHDGDAYAEALTVHDIDGGTFIDKGACPIEVLVGGEVEAVIEPPEGRWGIHRDAGEDADEQGNGVAHGLVSGEGQA